MKKIVLLMWIIIGILGFSEVSFKEIYLGMSKDEIIQKMGYDHQTNSSEIIYFDIEINGIKMRKVRFLFLFNSLYTASFDMKPGNGTKVFNFLNNDFGKALEIKSNDKLKVGIYSHIYSPKTYLLMADDKTTKESILQMLYEKDLNNVVKKLYIFRH